MALLAALTTESLAAHRAYVMDGLYVGTGLAKIARKLRERGYIIAYGSYAQAAAFAGRTPVPILRIGLSSSGIRSAPRRRQGSRRKPEPAASAT